MSLHQKLVVNYILDYFGILFILDISCVLREFILWDQRLLKDSFMKNSEKGTVKLYFLCLELCFNFLLINIENIQSLLLVSLLMLSRYAWLVTISPPFCEQYISFPETFASGRLERLRLYFSLDLFRFVHCDNCFPFPDDYKVIDRLHSWALGYKSFFMLNSVDILTFMSRTKHSRLTSS